MTFSEATSGKPGRRILAITDPNASPLHRLLRADVRVLHVDGRVRFFIGIGFPGFNSPANNRNGYETYATALSASKRYACKGSVRTSTGPLSGDRP